jgi:predicted site-specific integrase-resolvase
MRESLSTQDVADRIGVCKRTLLRWLYAGKIPDVRRERIGGIEVRLWNARDLQRAQRFRDESFGRRA